MAKVRGRIVRWTEYAPRPGQGGWQAIYREYRNGVLLQSIGKGSSRAEARQDAAKRFEAFEGFKPVGKVDTAES